MNIAVLGRTKPLLDTALLLVEKGHHIKLVITAKAAPDYSVDENDFESFANEIGAEFIHNPKVSADEIKDIVEKENIELAVSVNYTGVISQDVIDLFEFGVLNAHGGDLPRYRGNACQAWAIINGESKIGLCIHRMKGGELDSGNIVKRAYLPIDINTRIEQVYDWFETMIPSLYLQSVDSFQDKNYKYIAQSTDPKDALRCYPRIPADGEINWNQSAEDILRLINASSEPYAGAFCSWKKEKLIIWRAIIEDDDENYVAIPGQILERNHQNSTLKIATGRGKLTLVEMELNGHRDKALFFVKSLRERLL